MPDSKPSTKSVTLHLPIDVVAAIARLSRELEQPQSEILVNALRRGLEFLALESAPPVDLPVDLAQLADRLAALETLPAQLAELAAQVDRLLDAAAPSAASIAPSSAVLSEVEPQIDRCPRCDHKLNAPLKTSGRQVCIQCGWTNKPRRANAPADAELPPDQLQRLLDQAAADAIANMKPKKPAPTEDKKFPFGNRR